MGRRCLLIVVGACLLVSACHVSVSVGTHTTTSAAGGPQITRIQLAQDYQNGQAVNPTTNFPPNSTFHAVIQVTGAVAGTKVKTSWTAVDANGQQNQLIDEKEVDVSTDGPIDAYLTLPRPWPTGQYKVDVYLNNTLDRSIPFNVQ
ncbi:MAG: hypothetical protein M3N98_11080 [Actinomycetota bacterium]|nr:hypothetical protein [Actinomycetota bacterium]